MVLQGPRQRLDILAWSPDGRFIAGAATWTPVRLWDVNVGRLISMDQEIIPTTHNAFAFSPDGQTLAVGRSDQLYYVDTPTGGSGLKFGVRRGIEPI
jgi:WD40 repeat protein